MENQSKPKGKAVKLPETEKEDKPLNTRETARKAQDFARRVSPLALNLLEAKKSTQL